MEQNKEHILQKQNKRENKKQLQKTCWHNAPLSLLISKMDEFLAYIIMRLFCI